MDLPLRYETVNFQGVYRHWDYGNGPGNPANTNFAPRLAKAMRRNPAMKLFVGCGYYDLATPIGDAEYTLLHASIEMKRVQFGYYESGHLPYLGMQSRRNLAADLRKFMTSDQS